VINSLQAEYQELVQLSTLYVLQQFPKKRKAHAKQQQDPLPKIPAAASATSSRPQLEPLPIKAQPSAEVKPKILANPESLLRNDDAISILELLKTHCPSFKLLDDPHQALADVIILYDKESAEEKALLLRIADALQKQGHICLVVHIQECPVHFFQKKMCKLAIATKKLLLTLPEMASRSSSELTSIGITPLKIIPDLQLFIDQPTRRIEWWQELKDLLMNVLNSHP
jgi:hypothetical protein